MSVRRQGFTIVELLIVVVVTAVLATISVVSYNGISARAARTSVITDLRNIGVAMESFKAESGNYPRHDDPAIASQIGDILRKANLFTQTRNSSEKSFSVCIPPNRDNYAIVAWSPQYANLSGTEYIGKTINYITKGSSVKTVIAQEHLVGAGVGGNLCISASQDFMPANEWQQASPPWSRWTTAAS